MALTNHDNVYSPTSSVSGSSFSMLTSPPPSDDTFEAIDDSSSNEDEIVWTANEFDPDEDFILIPQSHPRSEPITPQLSKEDDASLPHEALSRLSLHDQTSATPTPTISTHLTIKSTPKPKPSHAYKGRRSSSVHYEVSGQTLASTAPKTRRGRKKKGRKNPSTSYPSPSPSPDRDVTDNISPAQPSDHKKAFCFGERVFVEESEGDPIFSKYEDAVCFITS